MLDISGYTSSIDGVEVGGLITQPSSALQMIQNIYLYGPLIIWAIAVVVLLLYKLDKKYASIMTELEEREARGEL